VRVIGHLLPLTLELRFDEGFSSQHRHAPGLRNRRLAGSQPRGS